MVITEFNAKNFRNLQTLQIECNPRFNLFYGLNGAGKSNLLESIYFLGTGKSFRTHLLRRVLPYHQDMLQLYASIAVDSQRNVAVGVQRSLNKNNQLRLGGETVASHSEIARFLPMQIISQSSYDLLEAGAGVRRRFLDWGVFHVEHNFYTSWQRLNRAIQQRNTAIRNHSSIDQITLWNTEIVNSSLIINQWRYNYFTQLLPIVEEILKSFLPTVEFNIEFHNGWPKDSDLSQILADGLEQDIRFGYTRNGAHRADILIRNIKNKTINASHTLSRGQQKLLVLALKLGQGNLFRKLTSKNCIFLIDDLPAELDTGKKALVFDLLQQLSAQIFITSVEAEHFGFLNPIIEPEHIQLFHVEQGKVARNPAGVVGVHASPRVASRVPRSAQP